MVRPSYSSRRPRPPARRQRKAVAFYTDDNPSTFTTKYKRGEQPPALQSQQQHSKSKQTTGGRRRKREEQSTASPSKKSQPQVEIDPSLGHVLPHCVTLAPVFPTNTSLSSSDPSERLRNNPSLKTAFGRGLGTPRPPGRPTWQNIAEGKFCHSMHDSSLGSSSSAKATAGATARTNGGGIQIATSTNKAASLSYMSSQKITCMAASSCQKYLAMGDTSGLITIYSLMSIPLPILTLSTAASEREKESNAPGIQKGSSKNKPLASQYANAIETLVFVGVNICFSTKNEIQLIDARENRIIWTHQIAPDIGPAVKLDISISGCCLSSFRCPSNIMNANKKNSTADSENTKPQEDDSQSNDTSLDDFSPCIMLQLKNKTANRDKRYQQEVQAINVLPKDKEGNNFSSGSSGAAIFDRSGSDRIIMLTQIYDRTKATPVCTQVLLLFSLDDFQIYKQTDIPVTTKGNKFISSEALSQSGDGKFTLVASMHEIRLFDTESLKLLSVYGEGISLHGDSVAWQDCFLIPNETRNSIEEQQVSLRENTYYEHEDELRYRQGLADDSKSDAASSSFLVVGVPHAFRKPHEYQDVLHFWEVNCKDRLPMFTIRAPSDGIAKSDGIGTALYCPDAEGAGRLILSTQRGGCFQMLPNKKSDWPGIMYPPGYLVIDDNLEYIEDEDEYDNVIKIDDAEDQGNNIEEEVQMDDDLAEAVRRSISEQSLTLEEVDTDVDVIVVDYNYRNTSSTSIPCRPDPSSMNDDELVEDVSASKVSSNKHSSMEPKNSFATSFLSLLPQKKSVQDTVLERLEESEMEKTAFDIPDVDAKQALPPRLARGKRAGRANLEALLKASIDHELRSFMTSRENWVDGTGSTLRSNARTISNIVTPDSEAAEILDAPCNTQGSGNEESKKSSLQESEVPLSNGNSQEHTTDLDPSASSALETLGQATSANANAVPFTACDLTGKVTESKITKEDSPKGVGDDIDIQKEPERMSLPSSLPETNSLKPTTSPILTDGDVQPSTLCSEEHVKSENLNGGTGSHLELSAGETIDDQSPQTLKIESGAPAKIIFTDQSNGGEHSKPKSLERENARNSRKCSNCDACWGRMVYHTCGIRELPIDYDAIARAEKEKREQEEAAKQKARAEKRRIADQKRREAKRQKKLEEEAKRKLEEDEIKQREIERKEREDEERRLESEDKERRRVELLQRLQERQNEMSIEEEIRHTGVEESYTAKRDEFQSGTTYSYEQQQDVLHNGEAPYYSHNPGDNADRFQSTTSYATHEAALRLDSAIDHVTNQSIPEISDAQQHSVLERRSSAPSAAAVALASLADVCFDASTSNTEAQPSQVTAQSETSYSHEQNNMQQNYPEYNHYGHHGATTTGYQQYEQPNHHQIHAGYNNPGSSEHHYRSYGDTYQQHGVDPSSSHWYPEDSRSEITPRQYQESGNLSSTWSYKEQPTAYHQNGTYTTQPQYTMSQPSNQYYSDHTDRSASMPSSSKDSQNHAGTSSEMQTSESRPLD